LSRKALRVFRTMGLILFMAGLGCAQTRTLTILHTNDTHSVMLPLSQQGIPRMKSRLSIDR